MGGVGYKLLIAEPRVAPDVFLASGVYEMGQGCECFCLIEGITSGEGDIGKGVRQDFLQYVFHGSGLSGLKRPALRVVASWTVVGTTGTVDGGAKARSVYCGVV